MHYLKKTQEWDAGNAPGNLLEYGFAFDNDNQLFLSYKWDEDGTDIYGILESVDLATGDVDWVSQNLGEVYEFGPVSYQEDSNVN